MFDHSARIKRFIGKVLMVKNVILDNCVLCCPNVPHPCGNLVNINNAAYELVKLAHLLSSNFPDETLNGSNTYFNWY